MIFTIIAAISFILGMVLNYNIIKLQKNNKIKRLNEKIHNLNTNIDYKEIVYNDLLFNYKTLSNNYETIQEEEKLLNVDIAKKKGQRQELSESLDSLREAAKQSGESLYQANYDLANSKFELAAEKLCEEFRVWKEEYEKEYLDVLKESAGEYNSQIETKRQECNKLEVQLKELRSVVDAAVEASRRKLEEEEKENFYRLILTETDINEIKRLREVLPYIKDAEALNKVIWTIYYQKPYTDLIGRIFGDKKPCGIYKITNLQNQMSYVGQSVNVPERWRQHIKRGIGAEPPTRNKLYPAMLAIGVENFSFEFIEECEKSQLDQREQFWQQYFHTKDFGYSIK